MRSTVILVVAIFAVVVAILPWVLERYLPFETPLEKLTFDLVIFTGFYGFCTYSLVRVANLQRQDMLNKEAKLKELENRKVRKRERRILIDILEELKHNLEIWWDPRRENTHSRTRFSMDMWQIHRGELDFLNDAMRNRIGRLYCSMDIVNSYLTKWQMVGDEQAAAGAFNEASAYKDKDFENNLKKTIDLLQGFMSKSC